MTEELQSQFGKWRSFFWPIHRTELKKFIPMLCVFFFIAFNYNLLHIVKDSLIVTAHESGAEALPFLKVWGILPAAILMTTLFTRLRNRYSREKVFYIMIAIFLSFFFLFTFILYPARDTLHPHELADRLQAFLPAGFKGLIALFRNWVFTSFYIMSDLWSTAILTVLFWGFANEVTTVKEAKRFYGLFATGGMFATIFSGQVAVFFSRDTFLLGLPFGKDSWEQSILFLNSAVILSGLCALGFFHWLNTRVLRQENTPPPKVEKKEKPKTSLRQNLAYLTQSKYLLAIALIVFACNFAINLIEIVWKNQIKELYPLPATYNAYMGQVMTSVGIIAAIISLFFTSNILRRVSWTVAALIPPIIMLVTGGVFFALVLFPDSSLGSLASFFGCTPLFLSVTFGSLQNSLMRASKYTLFDATKEFAFIPLDSESKLKGKAAIDGVGSRLGKSGGSVVHQGFLLLLTTISASCSYIAGAFFLIIIVWIYSVASLGKQFDLLTGKKTPSPETEPSPS